MHSRPARRGETRLARAISVGRSYLIVLSGALARVRDSAFCHLVLPRECGGCRRPGTLWCARCRRALADLAFGAAASPDAHGHPTRTPPVVSTGARVHGGG